MNERREERLEVMAAYLSRSSTGFGRDIETLAQAPHPTVGASGKIGISTGSGVENNLLDALRSAYLAYLSILSLIFLFITAYRPPVTGPDVLPGNTRAACLRTSPSSDTIQDPTVYLPHNSLTEMSHDTVYLLLFLSLSLLHVLRYSLVT